MNRSGILMVTGASRGIGAAVVLLAAARGYQVCVNYRTRRDAAEALVSAIRSDGGTAIAVQADTGREEDILRLFETCDRELGPVSHLVNNAGVTGPVCRVEDVTMAALRQVFDINVTGYFLCAREALRRMAYRHGGKGGAIVNISSRAAELGGPNEWVHYAASKGATDAFTIGLAKEVAGQGIRVNAVAPGLIETEIHAAAGMPDRLQRLASGVPLQRPGTAGEVAETVLFLLSEAASYVTGACLPVGGGR